MNIIKYIYFIFLFVFYCTLNVTFLFFFYLISLFINCVHLLTHYSHIYISIYHPFFFVFLFYFHSFIKSPDFMFCHFFYYRPLFPSRYRLPHKHFTVTIFPKNTAYPLCEKYPPLLSTYFPSSLPFTFTLSSSARPPHCPYLLPLVILLSL